AVCRLVRYPPYAVRKEGRCARRRATGTSMNMILFALGGFAFIALTLLILRYTTHLSNVKKGSSKH
ncbi:MAG: hypothetical protein K6T31_11325, partial [Alicyclobacillus sp.]|nr:hypothetical protein [Alicyclobacillus sp.]